MQANRGKKIAPSIQTQFVQEYPNGQLKDNEILPTPKKKIDTPPTKAIEPIREMIFSNRLFFSFIIVKGGKRYKNGELNLDDYF